MESSQKKGKKSLIDISKNIHHPKQIRELQIKTALGFLCTTVKKSKINKITNKNNQQMLEWVWGILQGVKEKKKSWTLQENG